MKKIGLQVFLLFAAGLLAAGCTMPFRVATSAPAVTQPPAEPTDAAETSVPQAHDLEPTADAEPSDAAATEPADDPAALCPAATEGTSLYVDETNGFCLLIPDDFTQRTFQEYQYDRVEFAKPGIDVNSPDRLTPALVVEINGNAGEQNGLQYARRWKDNFAAGQKAEPEEMDINGRQGAALVYETEFGPMSQAAFVTANDVKYRLVLSPALGTAPDIETDLQEVWTLAISSITFFPPQQQPDRTTPDEACPQAVTGFKQYINFADGYCLLYPTDFEPTEDFPGDFTGGPVLGEAEGVGEIKAGLTVGASGYYGEVEVIDLLADRMELIDAASVEETIISGYPAVTFLDPRGPWASRQAMILANGFVFTLVNQPYEPDRYPEGMPYVDAIWEAVTGSLAFFDPWR